MPIKNPELTPKEAKLECSLSLSSINASEGSDPKDSENKELRKIRIEPNSGGVMRINGFGGIPVVANLSKVKFSKTRIPILCEHDIDRAIGHADVTNKLITPSKINPVDGVLSHPGKDRDDFIEASDNKFPFEASIGTSPDYELEYVSRDESVKVNGRLLKGPLYVASDVKINEISVVKFGGDRKTKSIAASIKDNEMDFNQYVTQCGFDPEQLTEQQRASLQAAYDAQGLQTVAATGTTASSATDGSIAASAQQAQNQQIQNQQNTQQNQILAGQATSQQQQALNQQSTNPQINAAGQNPVNLIADMRAETLRQQTIQQIGNRFSFEKLPEIQAKAIGEGWTTEQFELHCHRENRPTADDVIAHTDGSTLIGEIEPIKCALLAQLPEISEDQIAKFYSPEAMDKATAQGLRGITIRDTMRLSIQAAGMRVPLGSNVNELIKRSKEAAQHHIQANAMSTLAINNIFDDVANKVLIGTREMQTNTHGAFTRTVPVTDFKPYNIYALDPDGTFKKVTEDGYLKHGGLSDRKYSVEAETYGVILSLDRKKIINDDLNAFSQMFASIEVMASSSIEEEVYKTLLAATISGGDLFESGKNQHTKALGLPGLKEARKLLDNRVDGNGRPVALPNPILLHGTGLEDIARTLYTEKELLATDVPTTSAKQKPNKNPYVGLYEPLKSPYLNNTGIKDREGAAIGNQSDTKWMLIAPSSSRHVAINVAALNGSLATEIHQVDPNPGQLAFVWQAFHDFGVGNGDPMGVVVSTGTT